MKHGRVRRRRQVHLVSSGRANRTFRKMATRYSWLPRGLFASSLVELYPVNSRERRKELARQQRRLANAIRRRLLTGSATLFFEPEMGIDLMTFLREAHRT